MLKNITKRVQLNLEPLESRQVLSVFGKADWIRASASESANYPYRAAVSIFTRRPDGSIGAKAGSGTMIGPNVVLTAGHVIWNERTNQWRNNLLVIPGQVDDFKPFGAAASSYVQSWTTYTNGQDARFDVGLIYLDRNLGNFTGWFGLMNKPESYFDQKGNVRILHYPADSLNGKKLVLSQGAVDYGTADFIRYGGTLDTEPGSSGAGVYVIENGVRYIVGVHHKGKSNTENNNQAVRLNDFWYKTIVDWKDDRTTTDLPDLMDRDLWFNARESSVSALGATAGGNFSVNAMVWNGGTAAANNVTVRFYASNDTVITTADTYLGQVNFASLAPFQSGRATWAGTLPSSMRAGSYHFGWIIDANNSVNEYRENNNTGYVRNKLVGVTSSAMPNVVAIFSAGSQIAATRSTTVPTRLAAARSIEKGLESVPTANIGRATVQPQPVVSLRVRRTACDCVFGAMDLAEPKIQLGTINP